MAGVTIQLIRTDGCVYKLLKDGVDVLQHSFAVVKNVFNETLESNQLHVRCLHVRDIINGLQRISLINY